MALKDLLADTRPFKYPDFKRLWTANIITVIGAQMTIVIAPAQIYAITQDSSYVGLAGIFGLVPLVLFGLYGGSLADSMDRRKLLIFTTFGLILSSGALALWAFLELNNVWVILCTLSVQQAFFAINQPTRSAIIPKLVPMHLLTAATTLNMTLMTFGAIAGPLLGGALIPVLGYADLYLFDTLALFVTLWAVIKLPPLPPGGTGLHSSDPDIADAAAGTSGLASETAHPPSDTKPTTAKPEKSPAQTAGFRSVIEGFAYLRAHTVLLMSFVVDIIAMVFGMPRALFPEIASETFGGPPTGGMVFAVLSSSMAVGAFLGGLFSGWTSRVRAHGKAVVWAVTVWGVAMTGFGLFLPLASLWWWAALIGAVTCMAAGGWADMVSAAFRNTILMQAADDKVRGRLQGVFIVVVAGGPRIADVVHGYAAALFGTFWAAFGGGVLVVVLVWLAVLCAPKFWRYRALR